jgi:hypothetical protein
MFSTFSFQKLEGVAHLKGVRDEEGKFSLEPYASMQLSQYHFLYQNENGI